MLYDQIMVIALLIGVATATYHFDCEYINSSTQGKIYSREMIRGDYTLSSEHNATWKNVTTAAANSEEPFGAAAPLAYMNGFSYDAAKTADQFQPAFFKTLPPQAIQAKNLVWDTTMFFQFAGRAKGLLLGQTSKFDSGEVALAGSGTFTNKNVELARIGTANIGGETADLIRYEAFFNSLNVEIPGGMKLVGRSHYWGDFYVRSGSTELLSGTLFEDVLGDLTIGSNPAQTINVFRKGSIQIVH